MKLLLTVANIYYSFLINLKCKDKKKPECHYIDVKVYTEKIQNFTDKQDYFLKIKYTAKIRKINPTK